MKRSVFASAAIVVALSLALAACASAPAKDAPAPAAQAVAAPAPAPAKAAPAPAALPDSLVLQDFETSTPKDLNSWHGGASTITAEVSGEQFHSGAKSLKVTTSQSDYAGCAVIMAAEKANWVGYKNLVFWMFGSKSGLTVHVYIEEGAGEMYISSVADDFTGWKAISIPFSGFTFRTDYQAGDAVIDHVLQIDKVKTVQLDTTTGKSVLYFDDFAVTN